MPTHSLRRRLRTDEPEGLGGPAACAGPLGAATSIVMIVVTNRIPVAKGHEIDFEDRFRTRLHLVDSHEGFVRNEVHRPKPMRFDREAGTWSPDETTQGYYEVKTWWRSMDDFVRWTQSDDFRKAHANRPPKEMFAGSSELTIHEVFTSSDLEVE